MDRRTFLVAAGALGGETTLEASPVLRVARGSDPVPELLVQNATPFGPSGIMVPDDGWRMWPDTHASWKDDTIYLPEDADLRKLPVNPPTGGWERLNSQTGIPLSLPSTVEQYFWGLTGFHPYHEEYKFEATDPEVKNGAYYGVSWWWRTLDIPKRFHGRRLLLHIRGMRQRAEVYLNRKLVGYSIMEELPFECDLTSAVQPGINELAIRITNPGGRLDWVDRDTLTWGGITFQKSHGFGGLDRALMISAHGPVRVADCWALNTPVARRIRAHATVENAQGTEVSGQVAFIVTDPKTGRRLAAQSVAATVAANGSTNVSCPIDAPEARLWDLDSPEVYKLSATWTGRDPSVPADSREVSFGFRWFAVVGLGSRAIFRLNGRRVRIYTAISWGFWALNGLFPIPELTEKEVRVAKQFRLNTLNFHRNLGKEDVLYCQDHLGLMRCLEPGGGIQAVGSTDPTHGKARSEQRYMLAKITGMIRAFRSHPSVIHYILQNEATLDLKNPGVMEVLRMMQQEDPSRSITGNDGFVMRSPQVWVQAYGTEIHVSGAHATADGGAGGWWVDHTGHFSDVWQDVYYKSPEDFFYRSTDRTEIVEWGEMKGAAASDNHVSVLREIRKHGGYSYDLMDHQEILAAYNGFLDTHGFREAFPDTAELFLSIGRRAYESWGQFMENVRICDENDMSAISGWESTAIENHSGLVDNFRDFKSDPRPIAESLLPVRPVAKQRALVVALGDRAVFDLYLLNDSNRAVSGELTLTLEGPDGRLQKLGTFPAPSFQADTLATLVREAVQSQPLTQAGRWVSRLALSSNPESTHECTLLVVDAKPAHPRRIRVGFQGVAEELQAQLTALPFALVEPFDRGSRYDVIVASGGGAKAVEDLSVDAEGAYKPGSAPPPEQRLPAEVLAAVEAGTPLLAMTPTDGQAVGVAKQLAEAGVFQFQGMVGPSRASWMGSWYFVKQHPLYEGLPVNEAMGIHYQVKSGGSNGWLVEGSGVEVVAGYGRDHDRRIGAGTMVATLGPSRIVLQRVVDMHPVFVQRFVANALRYLAG